MAGLLWNPISAVKQAAGDVNSAVSDIGAAGQAAAHGLVNNPVVSEGSKAANALNDNQSVSFSDIPKAFGGGSTPSKPATKPPTSTTDNSNQLQPMLNKAIAPYLSQLQSTLQNSAKQQYVQPWMPEAIKAPIAKFQALTGKDLNGLYKATATAAGQFVPAAAAQQTLNIIPTALAYNALAGSLPSFQNQPGLQALWQILEGTNAHLPNPAQSTNQDIITAISNLTPTATPDASTGTTSSTGGSTAGY
jgi:hypothetical protein